jgi:hypothetical protein
MKARYQRCSRAEERRGTMIREQISRRRLLKVGAGGAAAGLTMAVPGVARADDDDDDDALFVHIDGVVSGAEGTFKIDIDVAGTQDDLRGEGWDADPAEEPVSACIFVQTGGFNRRIVELQGRVLFANDPASLGALVETTADAKTGQIEWVFGGFGFTGTGRVVVTGGKD